RFEPSHIVVRVWHQMDVDLIRVWSDTFAVITLLRKILQPDDHRVDTGKCQKCGDKAHDGQQLSHDSCSVLCVSSQTRNQDQVEHNPNNLGIQKFIYNENLGLTRGASDWR